MKCENKKVFDKLLFDVQKYGKYGIFSKRFGEIYQKFEFFEKLYNTNKNKLIAIEFLLKNNLDKRITVDKNDDILFDENNNFIVDSSKGTIISLKNYYFKKKDELEECKKMLDFITKEFKKIKEISPDDREKYEMLNSYLNRQELEKLLFIDIFKEK